MARKKKPTKAGQSRATIERLIIAATEEFSQRGYADASTETIVRKAEVTRGALYHHFNGKKALFYAVFQAAQREIGRRIEDRANAVADPWGQLVAGCRAFLQACTEPALQQIVVIDAPAVLDWNAYREVDETMPGSGFPLLKEGLQELVAHMLSGAMDEAAVWIARCDDRERALAQSQEALESVLTGLLA